MKSNSFNNMLSFLITCILIFILAFIMMLSSIKSYTKAKEDIAKIEELQREKEAMIKEIEDSIAGIEDGLD